MSAASVTARGRAVAERMMVDTCTIKRQTGEVIDEAGEGTPTYTTVYTGKCRVQARNLASESPNVGQQRVDIYTTELQLPIAVTDVAVNDVVEITASLDPMLAGRSMRVNNLMYGTHKTMRRLSVEEPTS